MGFLFFGKKDININKRFSQIHNSLNCSFSKIKKDILSLNDWINHLDKHKKDHKNLLENIDSRLKYMENLVEGLLSNQTAVQTKNLSKQPQTDVRFKQMSVGVQTDIFSYLHRLTPMERALIWALLNTDMKLSYTDIARMLGKNESTVRGQINNIKRKAESLIQEKSELNGQKRFYIKESVKNKILKQYTVKNKKTTKK
jgi:DNA-binding CsgD family transcriptional regulator